MVSRSRPLPNWPALLAIALRELSAEALTIGLEELPLTSGEESIR
jgi:hypothetical protein